RSPFASAHSSQIVTPWSRKYLMLVSPLRNHNSSCTIAFRGRRFVVSIGKPAARLKRIWCPKIDKVPVPVRSCLSAPSARIRSSRSWYWSMASRPKHCLGKAFLTAATADRQRRFGSCRELYPKNVLIIPKPQVRNRRSALALTKQSGWAVSAKSTLRLHKHLVSLSAQSRQQRQHQKPGSGGHQHGRQRAGDEHAPVAARDQKRPPEVLFHQRPEHHAEQKRRRLEFMLDHPIADEAEGAREDAVNRRGVY